MGGRKIIGMLSRQEGVWTVQTTVYEDYDPAELAKAILTGSVFSTDKPWYTQINLVRGQQWK